jgi:hypothetical protein
MPLIQQQAFGPQPRTGESTSLCEHTRTTRSVLSCKVCYHLPVQKATAVSRHTKFESLQPEAVDPAVTLAG